MFYDDDVIKHICDYTNQYAASKGLPSGHTIEDIRCFIGMLLVSGYCQVPRVKMYWEMKDDFWNKGIVEAMPRNKFLNILRCLHVCNNNDLDPNTKFSKVSPLWKMLNKRWLKYFAGDVNLSVDESMIPHYGRHSTKQHIHGKPIRFQYKAWCLCTRFGYLDQGNLYEGANTGNKYPEVGVGGSVVLKLCEKLPQRPDGYNLYSNNFFTSVVLLEKLAEEGHNATGTIRANHVEKAPLSDVKSMSKMPRGSFDQLLKKIPMLLWCGTMITTLSPWRQQHVESSLLVKYVAGVLLRTNIQVSTNHPVL
ncbi:piggyBac transposable element-derived protein 3-like [Homalodisca vitripennis]|uniref:piggyBac transposable element-derived protein 3-like n=1 Tax=Homalodisca vitripennis TaxID=197043 RepID=UPI001EE9FA47|nr:piggyBac transposable element-derived protein 3-like [Homalodisca vitripennis]